VVGTVSRLARGRGVEHFLDAARAVVDSGAKAAVPRDRRGPAGTRAARMRASSSSRLTSPSRCRARASATYPAARRLRVGGESEGHGIFILVRDGGGAAVICTGVGGVLSFVRDGRTGCWSGAATSAALTARILGLLAPPRNGAGWGARR
jgi:hypothetical protein